MTLCRDISLSSWAVSNRAAISESFFITAQFVRQRVARLGSLKSAILDCSHTEFHLLKPGFANSEARNAPRKLSTLARIPRKVCDGIALERHSPGSGEHDTSEECAYIVSRSVR